MRQKPGFACLSEALKRNRRGEIDQRAVARYQDSLIPRLQDTRSRIGGMVVPTSLKPRVNPMVANAENLFDGLQNVLELVEEFLHDGCSESRDKAISLLDVLQEQFGQVF